VSTPPGPTLGPCVAWTTGAAVAACLGDTTASDFSLYDDVAVEASMVLYEASARQFTGLCERTVRPCRQACGCWSGWIPSDVAVPFAWGPWGGSGWSWGREGGDRCGCDAVSVVRLAGYPVRAVTEVKIGGVVLDELDAGGNPNWRLDGWRDLVRMDDPGPPVQRRLWPYCQNLSLDDTQPGTFSVSYQFGVDPPPLGAAAAAELAGELYQACSGGDCRLPSSVTRVIRQGVQIDRVNALSQMIRQGASGLTLVDTFVGSVNPAGLRRRPAVWSPDVQGFARKVGS
jgi:hypothetical protein